MVWRAAVAAVSAAAAAAAAAVVVAVALEAGRELLVLELGRGFHCVVIVRFFGAFEEAARWTGSLPKRLWDSALARSAVSGATQQNSDVLEGPKLHRLLGLAAWMLAPH